MKPLQSEKASRLGYWLLKDVDKAIRQFNMIKDGDLIAVAISGGKDSLTLLHLLDFRRKYAKEKYDLFAIHIVGDSRGTTSISNPDLPAWLRTNGFEYAIETMNLSENETLPMNCHRCSHNRRRTLFQIAKRNGCNKIAFGHHADDLAETTLLNLIFSGSVETMAPKASYFDGIIQVIRPMCFLFEKEIYRFAKICEFPSSPSPCPNSESSRRQNVARIIREVESWGNDFRGNLLRAGLRGIGSEVNSENIHDYDT